MTNSAELTRREILGRWVRKGGPLPPEIREGREAIEQWIQHGGDIPDEVREVLHPEIADRFGRVMQRASDARNGRWRQEPPTIEGWYWHWNGDEDSSPIPTNVQWSGTTNACFVSMGQLGLPHAIDCDKYGGWWLPMVEPATPNPEK